MEDNSSPSKNPIVKIASQLRRDARDMFSYIRDMPMPVVRVFLIGATLILLYKFFCTKKKFYREIIRPIYNFDVEFFGLGQRAWMYIATFVLLFLMALAAAYFLDRNKPKDLGVRVGDWRFGLRWTFIFLAIMLPVVFIVSYTDTFSMKYPLSKGSMRSLEAFLVWEAVSFLYFVGWEFYFRGYMLFSLHKHLGSIAIFIPMIPFVILHSSKPLPEALGAIFVAELLCLFALRAGSFWYGMILHWTINTAMDVAAIWQRGGFTG